jgi:GTP cyclohydrolase I
MARDLDAAAKAIDEFLRALELDSAETNGTGARVAEMFANDLTAGASVDTSVLVRDAVIETATPTLVVVRDIAVTTTCPHHLLPAIGKATIAFQARSRVIGLGTVAALVEAHARRLALQENIGEAIVAELEEALAPAWVACRLVLAHGCMIARGERAHGSTVETIATRGPADVSVLR